MNEPIDAVVARLMALADDYVLHFDKPYSVQVGAEKRNALADAIRAELSKKPA